MKLITNQQYERSRLHDNLWKIRVRDTKETIGFITRHPINKKWFWFMLEHTGVTFHDEPNDALEELVRTWVDMALDIIEHTINSKIK